MISCDDAYQYYRDFLYENGKKGATFVNVEKILKWKQVEINLKPLDTESAKKWQSQKGQIVQNFDRILQAKNNKKKEMKKNQPSSFFDSAKYLHLTTVNLLTDDSVPIEPDQQIESESVGKFSDTEKTSFLNSISKFLLNVYEVRVREECWLIFSPFLFSTQMIFKF